MDDLFPAQDIEKLGYPHQAIRGEKSYNGVAILSKLPLKNIQTLNWCGKEDCRHISAILPKNVELNNFYIPSGGDIPDPKENDKFAHKLKFLKKPPSGAKPGRTSRPSELSSVISMWRPWKPTSGPTNSFLRWCHTRPSRSIFWTNFKKPGPGPTPSGKLFRRKNAFIPGGATGRGIGPLMTGGGVSIMSG